MARVSQKNVFNFLHNLLAVKTYIAIGHKMSIKQRFNVIDELILLIMSHTCLVCKTIYNSCILHHTTILVPFICTEKLLYNSTEYTVDKM